MFDVLHLILFIFDTIAQILNLLVQFQLFPFHVGDVVIEFFDLFLALLDFNWIKFEVVVAFDLSQLVLMLYILHQLVFVLDLFFEFGYLLLSYIEYFGLRV